MLFYQGVPVTIHAKSTGKTNKPTVQIKYEPTPAQQIKFPEVNTWIKTVEVKELVNDFGGNHGLLEAINNAPFTFDQDGLHENVISVEPVVVETTTPTGTPKTVSNSSKRPTKYPVDIEVLKEMLAKGEKVAPIAKHFGVPYWKIVQICKGNGIKIG